MNKVEGWDHIVAAADSNIKTILVVDDEPENRKIFSELLSDLGYNVIDEPDGASALSLVRQGAKIDLVVTDERMPDMSGLELTEMLKKMRPSVPVILITAYGSIENYLRS